MTHLTGRIRNFAIDASDQRFTQLGDAFAPATLAVTGTWSGGGFECEMHYHADSWRIDGWIVTDPSGDVIASDY